MKLVVAGSFHKEKAEGGYANVATMLDWAGNVIWKHSRAEESRKEELLGLACEKYEKALSLNPDLQEALNNWGIALTNLADLAEESRKKEYLGLACEKYEKALSLKPDKYEALNNWASSLVKLSTLQKGEQRLATLQNALAKAQQAEHLRPGSGIYNMACCHALLGQTRKALAALKAAIESDPECRKMAADDPDFEALRKNKTFRALVSETKPAPKPRKAAAKKAG